MQIISNLFSKGEPSTLDANTTEMKFMLEALNKSQAVIQFKPDGTILHANENFLNAVGYTLSEIKGRHHSMFVDDAYKESTEYKNFWASLRRGEYQSAQYKRYGKNQKEIWIQASYNPIFDGNGKVEFADFLRLSANFGATTAEAPTAAAVDAALAVNTDSDDDDEDDGDDGLLGLL